MAVHSASRRPALLWPGWKHVAVALSIGVDKALKAAAGNNASPVYRRVMTDFLRKTGFMFLNKDDRACAVRLLPDWDEINEWRKSLSPGQQRGLNNPREVEAAFKDRETAPVAGKPRHPGERYKRKLPTPTEQFIAMAMQVELAEEARDRAEHHAEYLARLLDQVVARGRFSEETIAQMRARVRAELETMTGDEELEGEE
jgi:hypothetical protein